MHYWQTLDTNEFKLYDWGSQALNQEKYGQPEPPIIDLHDIPASINIAMFVGVDDVLGDVYDNRWVRNIIEESRKGAEDKGFFYYKEEAAGHIAFLVGQSMEYLDKLTRIETIFNY